MGWGERWEGASKGMGYMYTHGYIMLRFDRKQQNSFFSCLFIYVFYFTILYWFCHTVTWSCHGCTCVPHPESLSHLLPHPIPLGHSSAPAPSTLYHASNLDWRFVSRMIFYMFQCYSSHIILPSPSPTESKRLLYTSLSLLLSHIQGYCYHLSKFHIYALVYCIGVILCLTSLCIIGSSFIHLIRTDWNVLLLMAE